METVDLLKYEKELLAKGYKYIAGVDEVGRGPLAGPVVTCAVIMDLDKIVEGANDSKKLSPKKRDELFEKIKSSAVCYSITEESEKVIDEINILEATKKSMIHSIETLSITPDIVLVDAVKLNSKLELMPIIHGDALSYTIGCASILAKVYRDRLMEELSDKYPEYNFKKHKGYGTKEHIEALKKFGPCEIHRKSFIKNLL